MDPIEARQEAFTTLSEALKVLHASLHDDVSRFLDATHSLNVYSLWGLSYASPEILLAIVKETQGMKREDIIVMVEFLNHSVSLPTAERVIPTEAEREAHHAIMVAAVVCPLERKIGRMDDSPADKYSYDYSYLGNTLRAAVKMRLKSPVGAKLRLFLTGRVQNLSDYEKNVLRGHYFYEASKRQIAISDREWFGTHADELIPVWGTFLNARNFSLEYAEQLISGSQENGTALIDGML